ncbi:MAG TPA: LysR substrate-binding domain-containing protein, partial [Planctomycetaceae bacterium]|nr:LysR substrate-binding domain-containing protein [Planctomycetaceae bacterium]
GMGISIVTSICLTGDENLATLPLSRYFPKRTYGLVIRKGKFLSPAAARFVALMQEAAPRRLPEQQAPHPAAKPRKSGALPRRKHPQR